MMVPLIFHVPKKAYYYKACFQVHLYKIPQRIKEASQPFLEVLPLAFCLYTHSNANIGFVYTMKLITCRKVELLR